MDITWLVFIVPLIISGLWAKHINTLHMRKLAKELKEKP